jgi:uncharacterized protein involved in response to NO
MSMLARPMRTDATGLLHTLGDEGFRLFFPLAALHAALWPFLWVAVHGFALPLAREVPPGLWHAHEMLAGAFGAALIGFITTATPEWTDTPRLQGRALFTLALLWGAARLVGLLGAEPLLPVAALADLAWLGALVVYLASVAIRKGTGKLNAFLFWTAGLWLAELAAHAALLYGDVVLAQKAVHMFGFLFLGLLGLALARITVPVTNLVLDPSEETSPFRPHPGRLHLAPGLMAVAIAGEICGLSAAVSGFLFIAAGAAFLDRVAEGFIGREALRAEIVALGGASGLAGCGLLAIGAARLGAPWTETGGLHLAFMGGLGLGMLTVQSIAGLLHSGGTLGLAPRTRLALLLAFIAAMLRVLPEFGWDGLPGGPHLLASVTWGAAFLTWLTEYWPRLSDRGTLGPRHC